MIGLVFIAIVLMGACAYVAVAERRERRHLRRIGYRRTPRK